MALVPLSVANGEYEIKDQISLFNKYFGSVCTTDNGDIPTVDRIVPDNVALDDVDFNRDSILRALGKIKPNESSGPDYLRPVFVSKLSLTYLLDLSRYCSLALCR